MQTLLPMPAGDGFHGTSFFTYYNNDSQGLERRAVYPLWAGSCSRQGG